MDELKETIIKFQKDRNWKQFHTPENLAKSISIEAGELLEHFQWDNTYELEEVADELADVFNYCILINRCKLSVYPAVRPYLVQYLIATI